MTHIRPLQFGEFADVVYNGQRGHLGGRHHIFLLLSKFDVTLFFVVITPGGESRL